jgi:hypothetical protein
MNIVCAPTSIWNFAPTRLNPGRGKSQCRKITTQVCIVTCGLSCKDPRCHPLSLGSILGSMPAIAFLLARCGLLHREHTCSSMLLVLFGQPHCVNLAAICCEVQISHVCLCQVTCTCEHTPPPSVSGTADPPHHPLEQASIPHRSP